MKGPCILLALTLVSADALAEDSRSVFLAKPNVIGVEESVGVRAIASMAEALGAREEVRVVTPEELQGVLDLEKTKGLVGCEEDAACVAEVTKASKTDLVIATTVGRVGKTFVATLTLVSPDQAAPLGRESVNVPNLEKLDAQLKVAVARLLGLEGAETKVAYHLPQGKLSFAVLDLQATGVDAKVTANLTQLLSAAIKRVEGATVISRDDLVALLSLDKLNQMVGEDCDTSCVAELGGALGVDKLISGSVGTLGETYFISLRLIDPNEVKTDNRITESFKGTEDQLIRAINHAARSLLGLEASSGGALVVTASQEAAEVYVDNERVGELPLPPIPDLKSGRHSVRLVKGGYFDWQQDAYVEPGDTTAVWAELERRPEQWYEKWWVWTAVGGAVVVGLTATLIVANRAPENGRVDLLVESGPLRPR
ncbi:MAG: PEGA domain-containing protein [Deltaproteobacteria bacterium]